ncbi:MAG: hypothetical protein M0Z65_07735 [Firmicutes bacterium]|uniref:YgiT-type zinc finger domain-containing protein n=1 Tax=Melghirimyces thermohalophilus TaxID=1236220 RepID=A0A1G6PY45_9BACL|nr:hypothetical protein [Melghirimyces thermohalophilus]MDA8353062.1 hypothetical protein [Bacillota bacterium]SDC84295.1 hypothetical protein SAMN04488112_11870 [Melghirimyces thermohalophilus]
MGFCCGAGMVGGMGTIQYESVKVHHVPLQFCPVCHRMEVHPSVEREFELLLEFAQEDGARELNLGEQIGHSDAWKESCSSLQDEEPETLLRNQIDTALDLMSVARHLEDHKWEAMLKHRLRVLSRRLDRYRKARAG